MKKLFAMSLMPVLMLAWHSSALAQNQYLPEMLTLYQGESKVLEVDDISRIAVGKSALVSTTILKHGELVFTADEVGETNMQVWFGDGSREEVSLIVVESNSLREITEIKQLLSDVAGIKIKAVGRRLVIEGNVMARDLERINIVKQRYPNVLVLAQEGNEFMEEMIYFDVRVTEFNSDDMENLGIAWDTSISGPTGTYRKEWRGDNYTVGTGPLGEISNTGLGLDVDTGNFDPDNNNSGYSAVEIAALLSAQKTGITTWGIASSIASRISFLEHTGSAVTLASPRLSTRSGGSAELQVGGQVPVVTTSVNGPSVQYKDYGIILNVEPKLDLYGNIAAKVMTEVSQLDVANSVGGYPALKSRKTENDIRLKPGETLVLAGLLTREDSKSVDKVKWLADIPILGELFKSKSFSQKKTELVIFLTPTVMGDLSQGINQVEVERSKKFMTKFDESMSEGLVD